MIELKTLTVAGNPVNVFRTSFDTVYRNVGSIGSSFRFGVRLKITSDFRQVLTGASNPVNSDGTGNFAMGFSQSNQTQEVTNANRPFSNHILTLVADSIGKTRNVGPPVSYTAGGTVYYRGLGDRFGSSGTPRSYSDVGATFMVLPTGANVMVAAVLEIVRGDPDYTYSWVRPTSASLVNKTHADLLSAINEETMDDVATVLGAEYGCKTGTLSGMAALVASDGDFDTIYLSSGIYGTTQNAGPCGYSLDFAGIVCRNCP